MKFINKISKGMVVAVFVLVAAFGFAVLAGGDVFAAPTDDACKGLALTGADCDKKAAETSITGVIETVIDVLSYVVGVVSVIMIIIGGMRYILSSGDSSATASARNTVIYALVGLVVVIFAQALVAFVITNV